MRTGLILSLFISLVSCSSAQKRDVHELTLRPFQEETLPNGLKVIFIPDQSLPRLSMELMVKAGTATEHQGAAGMNALVASLLDQGTKSRKAPDIADTFAQIGVDYGAGPGQDFTVVSAAGLALYQKDFLNLYSDVIMHPAFERREFERVRSRHLAEIVKAQDQPSSYADEILDHEIFGNHPYSYPVIGTKESLKKMKREDIVHYYEKYYRPGNSILSVVGAFDDNFKNEVKKVFSAWPAGGKIAEDKLDQPDGPKKILKIVSKNDLKQTQIRMGHVGIRRTDPDYMALRMANLILGGSFESRLNQRVRDDLGLTYSIHSSSEARLDRGAFQISTFTRNEKAAETIRESLNVLKEFVQKGVTEPELAAGKALMVGQFPASIETPDRLATNLMVLRRYGISDDYLAHFNKNVGQITVAQVNDAIRRHLQPDRLKIVVYADKSIVLTSLKSMGDWTVEDAK